MAFLQSGSGTYETFLTRCRDLSVASVAAGWALVIFAISEDGWRYALLLLVVLPPIAAYLAIRGKREIHTGKAVAGFLIALASIPLGLWLATLESA